jgi:hypothetical protein
MVRSSNSLLYFYEHSSPNSSSLSFFLRFVDERLILNFSTIHLGRGSPMMDLRLYLYPSLCIIKSENPSAEVNNTSTDAFERQGCILLIKIRPFGLKFLAFGGELFQVSDELFVCHPEP